MPTPSLSLHLLYFLYLLIFHFVAHFGLGYTETSTGKKKKKCKKTDSNTEGSYGEKNIIMLLCKLLKCLAS